MKRQHIIVLAVAAVIAAIAWERGTITVEVLLLLGVLIPSIILHEVSHGWAALSFGDTTAKEAGRLTLNPLAHVDLFGTLILPAMLVLSGGPFFGYAKPVPVNPRRMRDPRNHSLIVALAGPGMNLLIVAIATLLFRLALGGAGASTLTLELLYRVGIANIVLAAFNLIPIPPLDGSAIVERVLPRRYWPQYLRLRQYSMFILLGIFLFMPGLFGRLISPAVEAWQRLLT